jgi:hypothetical protein
MKKLLLTEWAAIGELVGTAAVVISLLFLAYSVGQNTEAVQGSMENLIFEQHAVLQNHFITDPTMAELYVRMGGEDPQLTDIEQVRWDTHQVNFLDLWALAFTRHEEGLLADDPWSGWNVYFIYVFSKGPEKLSFERWNELSFGFGPTFWTHVGVTLGFHDGTDRI